MSKEYAERERIRSAAFREGSRRTIEDMRRLIPREKYNGYDPDTGKERRVGFIDQFPNPHERGPHFRVIAPMMSSRTFGRGWENAMAQTIDFRPIEHYVTYSSDGSTYTLRYFNWQPVDTPEGLETGKELLATLRDVHRAEMRLRSTIEPYSPGWHHVKLAIDALREVREEIRRRNGHFEPLKDEVIF